MKNSSSEKIIICEESSWHNVNKQEYDYRVYFEQGDYENYLYFNYFDSERGNYKFTAPAYYTYEVCYHLVHKFSYGELVDVLMSLFGVEYLNEEDK